MMKTLIHYAKSLLQAVIIFIFLSLIVDWVRKPDQPLQSAAQTLTLTDGQTNFPFNPSAKIGLPSFIFGAAGVIFVHTHRPP